MQNTDITTEIKTNAIEFLNEISKEEHFKVTYVLITKDSSKRSVKMII